MSKTKLSPKIRYEIIERDGRKCLWCGKGAVEEVKLEVDHIIPESFGGSSLHENLGTLCSECNKGKSNDYVGNYLLMTLLKIPNLELKIKLENTNQETMDGKWYDGKIFYYEIEFYKKPEPSYSYGWAHVVHHFPISNILLGLEKNVSCNIQIDLIKRENLLIFKNKLRDFLIENKGYLEEINGRIVFIEKR